MSKRKYKAGDIVGNKISDQKFVIVREETKYLGLSAIFVGYLVRGVDLKTMVFSEEEICEL